jgi:acyl carrier protein
MNLTVAELRPMLVNILLAMGELTDEQGVYLNASLDNDVGLAQLNFNSLTMLDFCLQVETSTDIVFEPDELVTLETLRAVETAILAKRPN